MFDYKIVTQNYFLDEMQSYEVPFLLENLSRIDRNGWEQTRLIVYAIGSLFAKKQKSITDFLKLPWDEVVESVETEKITEISNDDIERLKKLSNEMLDKITE